MVLKAIVGFFLSIGLCLTAYASPALEEQGEWCKRVAEDAHTGANANQVLKIPGDVFTAKLMNYAMTLFSAVDMGHLTKEEAVQLIEAVIEGYESTLPANEVALKVFEGCMARKNI